MASLLPRARGHCRLYRLRADWDHVAVPDKQGTVGGVKRPILAVLQRWISGDAVNRGKFLTDTSGGRSLKTKEKHVNNWGRAALK